ncbi:precorrin-8X methylmutase [Guggenheimella bovis]
MIELERVLPEEIEKRSFELIKSEMKSSIDPDLLPILMRVIHTTADFEYEETLTFSEDVLASADKAFKEHATIVTDTTMALSGINKKALEKLGLKAVCFIGDEDVREHAKANGTTRSKESMKKAASLEGPLIFAIGNAPTALIELYELIVRQEINPALIIGVPVGFVNVVQSKELILLSKVPYIVNRGRKGGSNVAAAIVNALMYRHTRG